MSHDPARQTRLVDAARKGGSAKSHAARAKKELLAAGALTAEQVLAYLGLTIHRLHEGKIESGVASAMASLGRAWFAGRAVILTEELERRIGELEAAVKGQAR